MSDVNQTLDPVQPTDTQDDITTSPSIQPTRNDVEEQDSVGESASDINGIPDNNSDQETIRDQRYAGKLKQVQDELEKIKQERDSYQQRFTKTAEYVSKDPQRFKEALMDTNGWSSEEAESYVTNLKTQGYWQQQNQQLQQKPIQQVQEVDIDRKVDEVLEKREAINNLIETFPNLKEKNEANNESFKKAYYMAQAWMNIDKSLTLNNALIKSYGQISGSVESDMSKAKEAARLQGMAEANGARASMQPSAVSKPTKSTNSHLSEKDREIANMWGMNADEYLKYKGKRTITVD